MRQTTILTKSGYAELLRDLKTIIQGGRRRAQQAVSRELVRTYWQVGKRIVSERLTANAGYGEAVMEELSRDLNMDLTTLKRSLYFFQQYEKGAPWSTNLTWSHYKALIGIHNDAARAWYEQEAVRGGWTKERLMQAIRRQAWQEAQTGDASKRKPQLKRPRAALYVYKAIVVRVVDGDTLLVRIDLGFQVLKEQRIRLAEINTPEKETRAGQKASRYVRDRLARIPFIVIKTHKIDLHGRYVAHVFYSFTETRKENIFETGRYLNQELLDRKLAVRI